MIIRTKEILSQGNLIDCIRIEKPLIHCITNFVTVQDVANMVLAIGAAPVMASSFEEVEEVTALAKALVINMGTLRQADVPAMILAGKKAAELGHPIVLDPVGVGSSQARTRAVLEVMKEVPFTVIRGNASEIKTLVVGTKTARGVDAEDGEQPDLIYAQQLSKQTSAVVAVTGEQDLITDGVNSCSLEGGHPLMARITGSGCMLDGILAAHLAVKQETPFWSSVYALASFGYCGELAAKKVEIVDGGTGSFRMFLFDEVSKLNSKEFWKEVKIEG